MPPLLQWRRIVMLALMLLGLSNTHAELPQPLTLEQALSMADVLHPSVLQAQAVRAKADADLAETEAEDDLQLSLEGRLRWVESSVASSDTHIDDHKASLLVRKKITDFGRQSARRLAAQQSLLSSEQQLKQLQGERRLAIMQAFFDVLLSDKKNARDNEEMAIAFISLDRLRNRREMGQASDIAVLESESHYQKILLQVREGESRQRLTRSHLANVLNAPGDLPSSLVEPALDETPALPGYDDLLAYALRHNLQLKAKQQALVAAEQQLVAAGRLFSPSLDAEVEAADYSRELGSSDRWRAGVVLSVPIYNGGRADAALAHQRTRLLQTRAELEQTRLDLRQQLLKLWLELQEAGSRRERALSELDYRELYLDRSRANYEMEVQADLGDAMVRLSDAQIALAESDYRRALLWARLEHLVGGVLPEKSMSNKGDGQ